MSNVQSYLHVLCDIDGTLADCTHRLHHVREKPKDWKAFFKGIPDDAVISPVFRVIESLHRNYYKVILLSGRGEEYREETEEWLDEYKVPFDELIMRKAKDSRGDEIVKRELFESRFPTQAEKSLVLGIFDDRPKVIRMWREIGVFVFNVGTGVEF